MRRGAVKDSRDKSDFFSFTFLIRCLGKKNKILRLRENTKRQIFSGVVKKKRKYVISKQGSSCALPALFSPSHTDYTLLQLLHNKTHTPSHFDQSVVFALLQLMVEKQDRALTHPDTHVNSFFQGYDDDVCACQIKFACNVSVSFSMGMTSVYSVLCVCVQ